MSTNPAHLRRRGFLVTAATAAGVAALPTAPARAAAKYTRYDVTSAEGQQMLASYAKGVTRMLALPPGDPHNWFRNAFVHVLDCPHGNWWFYVWHRGFVGHFEQTVRVLSGDPNFAFPYWDWTKDPYVPEGMFKGVLTPKDAGFSPFTKDMDTFTKYIHDPMLTYWNTLNAEQRQQMSLRGYNSFDDVWASVNGGGSAEDAAFAPTSKARYLTAQNPKLSPAVAKDCAPSVIQDGLSVPDFYADDKLNSFNSIKTPSHVEQPDGTTWFSILEGLPHNNVHNYLGGVGSPNYVPPYGNMTNFLSPVDPIFFLHHANMDRLWDVWTKIQKAKGLPFGPGKDDEQAYMTEPFRFFVSTDGTYLTNAKAADYFSTDAFDYDYSPGSGSNLIPAAGALVAAVATKPPRLASASVAGNVASAIMPISSQSRLIAAITVPVPEMHSGGRSFDVLLNAPPGTTQANSTSPNFVARISFFGPAMHHMKMGEHATFIVPLSAALANLKGLTKTAADTKLTLTVLPASGKSKAPVLKEVSFKAT